jgi:hypothetical protein
VHGAGPNNGPQYRKQSGSRIVALAGNLPHGYRFLRQYGAVDRFLELAPQNRAPAIAIAGNAPLLASPPALAPSKVLDFTDVVKAAENSVVLFIAK